MLKLFSAVVAFIVITGCGGVSPKSELKIITQTIQEQQDAWNNGDLRGFMNGYWMNDSLRFSGGKLITYGWEPALVRYQKTYDSKEKMGRLEFTNLDSKLTGNQSALSTGAWTLYRDSDTLYGRFTLVWQKVNGAWVIIADHSS